jgi:hypothetical protein
MLLKNKMEIYWFERNYPIDGGLKNRSKDLESNGFDGTMYPYGTFINDYFTRIARDLDVNSKFKYIVAIRPYVISAQYLHMICSSLNELSYNRVSINFLTGWILENEKEFGGVLYGVNDNSSNIDRSNYMLEYAKEFKRISDTKFYISTTNESVFEYSVDNNFPMIIPYSWYKVNRFNLDGQKYLISVAPVISDYKKDLPQYQDADLFTKEEFFQFLDDCNLKNVSGVLIQESGANQEYNSILSAIKEYRNRS